MAIETLATLYRAAGHHLPPVPQGGYRPSIQVRDRGQGRIGLSGPYDATSNRRTAGWSRNTDSINSLLYGSAETLRAHCRDAVRKTPWAANAIDVYVANAVGTGIQPISQYEDPKVREQIHKAWRRWTDEADFDDQTDFYGLQALGFREMLEAGEVLFRLHIPDDPNLSVPLQIQVLEADHLPLDRLESSKLAANSSNKIRYGIEFNPRGKRVAYHLYRDHPGEVEYFTRSNETTRVPASEVIHMYRSLRAGQVRGEPHLTRVLLALRDLDEYTDAARMRKKMAAMLAGFIKRGPSSDPVEGIVTNEGGGVGNIELQSGILQELRPGEDIVMADGPKDDGFAEFMQSNLQAIAVGAGITFEQLSGDLSEVNYSSIRAGLLEFRRKCEQLQYSVIVYQLCRRVFRVWLPLAVLSGAVNLPHYSARKQDYLDVAWMTPGWPWVDPLDESKAALNDIQAGITSLTRVVSARGENLEQIMREKAAEKKLAKEFGLVLTSDPENELKAKEPDGGQQSQPVSRSRQSAIGPEEISHMRAEERLN